MLLKWGEWQRRVAGAIVACGVLGVGAVLAGPAADAATVTVARGQTLSGIAARYHVSVSTLMTANHLTDPDYVQAGSVLQVPATGSSSAPATVVVGLGQTLTSIAVRYGVSVASLVAANGIGNPDYVQAGTRLRIPAPQGSDLSLASYSVPAGIPAGLRSHPSRLALQPDFAAAASRYGVPEPLLEALCWWESGWQTSIVSSTGAIGVCQIEPSTAALVNSQRGSSLSPYVPGQNIDLGAIYLASLLRQTGGNESLAIAGYYQGLGSVRRSGMFSSTAIYVRGIEAYARIFGA